MGRNALCKKREFNTFSEAQEEMNRMENDSDTERENVPKDSKCRRRQALKPISPLLDLNHLIKDDIMVSNIFQACDFRVSWNL